MATIEIDGKTYQAENGKMIIEVADENGVHIPRFCYHKKLSVAANCRMCLVQVENSRKPVPACATPVADGMKVYTKSPETIRSQKAVMEFLLINHPLDCPICDQGGECELQDVSLGFGQGISAYKDTKRAVNDDDLGSLISTEMTRCIHCTRCVRFGEEVAGVRELGATGRGENMQIGTYINHAMTSEVSGNVIDLCPVGALTSKPYRFTARPWEMQQYKSVSPHDCLGSNIFVHVRGQEVMRVVPRDCEEINETWISDRDRYSYLGLKHSARALCPKIKKAGVWQVVDWATALNYAALKITTCINQHGQEHFAAFASSSSTLEEFYLLQKFMRHLGVNNLDHRLKQTDFCDQDKLADLPVSSLPFAELENQANIFLLGTNLGREVPLAAIRVRKAQLASANVYALNPVSYDFPFHVTQEEIVSPHTMLTTLCSIVLSCVGGVKKLPKEIQPWFKGIKPTEFSHTVASALQAENSVIVTGFISESHPDAAILRSLVNLIGKNTKAKLLRLTQGANALGAHFAGMLPHKGVAGDALPKPGLEVNAALKNNLTGAFLLNVEPDFDFANSPLAKAAFIKAECVIVLSAFADPSIEEYADVILPIASFAETAGTYINIDQTWQTVKGCVTPPKEARPAWKVLRVLGNLANCPGFDYASSEDVLAELLLLKHGKELNLNDEIFVDAEFPPAQKGLVRVGEWPLYAVDGLVRRANALQESGSADKILVKINPLTAKHYKLGKKVKLSQGGRAITLPFIQDEKVAKDVVWVLNAMPETIDLGAAYAKIAIKA
ncbi:MAG: NADH-quinone oxidoreductase subunit G [Legionellales bacterium RIFCSPHIGHO2_12_FULL_37_14]|nr:MAG: NADH-quinone oxidoreductase subunit G [Legionellales bacterium RIFCSPHIGHO2_12_FULL_37_14]